jgi:hypothetical protein
MHRMTPPLHLPKHWPLGLAVILLAVMPHSVRAQHEMVGLLSPEVGTLAFHGDYRIAWLPDQHVEGQGTRLGLVRQDVSAGAPIWQDASDEFGISASLRAETFDTNAILPDTRQPFPDDLWNIHMGVGYRHLFENEWIAGGNVTVGSASDKPFHSINEMTVGATAFLRIPQGEHNAWLFTLNFSTNREFLNYVPLPGVAYLWEPNDWFRAVIGVPFAFIVVKPIDDLTLTLSYAPLTTVHAKAVYRVWGPVRIYGGFDWEYESYYLADRLDERSRLFYYDKRLSAGVMAGVSKNVLVDLSTGYEFGRSYFEGRNFTDRSFNRLDPGDSPFVALRVEVRF